MRTSHNRITREKEEQIIDLFHAGRSFQQIAIKARVGSATAKRVCYSNGLFRGEHGEFTRRKGLDG